MNIDIKDCIAEMNQSYNDLGDDLLMLEAVALASVRDMEFPWEYVASSMDRLEDYIRQHTEELCHLTEYLTNHFAMRP